MDLADARRALPDVRKQLKAAERAKKQAQKEEEKQERRVQREAKRKQKDQERAETERWKRFKPAARPRVERPRKGFHENDELFWKVVDLWTEGMVTSLDMGVELGLDPNLPPMKVLKALQERKAQGLDVALLTENVGRSKAAASVQASTMQTYTSHLKMIAWAAEILDIPLLEVPVKDIRKVAVCVNHTGTLRGYLSAWRLAHVANGMTWQGDSDDFLGAVRRGALLTTTVVRQKVWLQRAQIKDVLDWALEEDRCWFGFKVVFIYTFMLRAPSEFFAQFDFALVEIGQGKMEYGPIKRKAKKDKQIVPAYCTCSADHSFCLHKWWPVAKKAKEIGVTDRGTCKRFMDTVRAALIDKGYDREWVKLVGSHSIRRGAAMDAALAQGPEWMLKHGGWASLKASRPYVPQNEMEAMCLAQVAVQGSEDEAE